MSITHHNALSFYFGVFEKKMDTIEKSDILFCSNICTNCKFYIILYIIKSLFLVVEDLWDQIKQFYLKNSSTPIDECCALIRLR